jgi:hypothetical protein
LIGEVTVEGVTVRVYMTYEDLKIGDEMKPDYQVYECGEHSRPKMVDFATKMKEVAKVVATFNKRIPPSAPERKIALIAVHGGSADAAFRMAHKKGLIVLPTADLESGRFHDTIAHEASHGIFEYHAGSNVDPGVKKPGVPDALVKRIAELYVALENTKPVPVPTTRFDAKNPPPLTGEGSMKPAGLVMVLDTLWATSDGGHPWHGVDEFFASAFAGFVQQPLLLKDILAYYGGHDAGIKPLAKELLQLLGMVGKPDAVKQLKNVGSTDQARRALISSGAPVDFTQKTGPIGWLVEPLRMPSPPKIFCGDTEVQPMTDDELLEILEEDFGSGSEKEKEEERSPE